MVGIPSRTSEGLEYFAINRIPAGYTQYHAGIADDITNGNFGGGVPLVLDASNTTRYFQLLNHWFVIGGRAFWEGGKVDDYIEAEMVAPATTGLTQQTGDFDKYALGGGLNMIIPVPEDQGSWDMDLTAKLNANVDILKATPVPSPGNQGWFNYDADTNVITPCGSQSGGYNLFDFDVVLHKFCRRCYGFNGHAALESADVIGKKVFNFWKFKFTITVNTSGARVGINLTTAVKGNV